MVRHVIQYASEDNVICELVEWPILVRVKITRIDKKRRCLRCSIDQANAGDEDVDIAVVESTYLAHNVASREHQRSPREESRELPGFVTTFERVSWLLMWLDRGIYRHCQMWTAHETAKKKAQATGAPLFGA